MIMISVFYTCRKIACVSAQLMLFCSFVEPTQNKVYLILSLHVTTVTLSWRVQNIVVIGRVHFTLECFEFSSNFEFDRNMLSGTGAWSPYRCYYPSRYGDIGFWPISYQVSSIATLALTKTLMFLLINMISNIDIRNHIQSSAVITRSSIERYYINNYRNWGRIYIGQMLNPQKISQSELWGIFVHICEK